MQTRRRTRARWVAEGLFAVAALGIAFWAWLADPPWLERHLYGYRCLHEEYGVASLGWRWVSFRASMSRRKMAAS